MRVIKYNNNQKQRNEDGKKKIPACDYCEKCFAGNGK